MIGCRGTRVLIRFNNKRTRGTINLCIIFVPGGVRGCLRHPVCARRMAVQRRDILLRPAIARTASTTGVRMGEMTSNNLGMKSKFVIAQFPNWQLMVMFAGWLGTKLTQGQLLAISKTVFYIGGILWAYEELFNGVNRFRKLLGAVVMSWLIFSLVTDLT